MSFITMDANALKNKASNRRAGSGSVQTVGWKCNYCGRTYVRERAFMEHICKGKRRLEQLKTPIGQSAFACYNDWMKLRRFSAQKPDTFMNSQFYVQFIKFAEYCIKMNIDPKVFMKLMHSKHPDIGPALWCSSPIYSLYLKYYDTLHDPFAQFQESIEYLEKQSTLLNCPVNEVLHQLGFQHVLEAFRLKKLSPWFLYTTKIGIDFLNKVRDKDKDDYALFESIINAEVWIQRFRDNRDIVIEMQKLSNELF